MSDNELQSAVEYEAGLGTLRTFAQGYADAGKGVGRDDCPYDDIEARVDDERVLKSSWTADAWRRGWDKWHTTTGAQPD